MSSSPTPSLAPDFAARATTYDALRPGIPGLDAALVRAGDLAGRRVVDVGCGTGRFAEVLHREHGAEVTGVDPEPVMLAVAQRRASAGLSFAEGRAEQLPFEDACFERATMVLSCHLVERAAAFAEVRRVLAPEGRLAIATFDPGYFSRYYLNEFFPSVLAIDLARFPSGEVLRRELVPAGFVAVGVEPFAAEATVARAQALARIRGRHISTFDLIGEEEYREGLERAERELPDRIPVRYDLLLVTAS